ncbi:unnamed protein product [Heterosigma akashiwo]
MEIRITNTFFFIALFLCILFQACTAFTTSASLSISSNPGKLLRSTSVAVNDAAKEAAPAAASGTAPEGRPKALPRRLTKTEKARTVTHVCTSGTLATLGANAEARGFPFGSHVDFVLNEQGWPVFLLSEQSMHTLNFKAQNSVSLFAQQPAAQEAKPHPATLPRVTITGSMEKITDMDELILLRPTFSVAHGYAEKLVESPVFAFYKLRPESIYYIGGFGVNAAWFVVLLADELESPFPRARRARACGRCQPPGAQHAEDLATLCSQFLGVKSPQEATVTNLDRLGFNVRVSSGKETDEFRIGFNPLQQVFSVEDAKSEIVKLFQEAWEKKEGNEWAQDYQPPVEKYASDILRK